LKFLFGLAHVLTTKMGVTIACGRRVLELSGNGPVVAKLADGTQVTATAAVSATNVPTPINWTGIYTKQAAYRTYVIGLEVAPDQLADALYWDTLDPYHYVRLHATEGRFLLLVGGEDHKVGQGHGLERGEPFEKLERWARAKCASAGAVVHRWSGQVNEPDDGVAFIGRAPSHGDQACMVITGDSGMGLTHGALGAMIVSDLILGRVNLWSDLYSPSRKPLSAESMSEFVRQNANFAAQLKDYVTAGEVRSTDEIGRDCGALMRDGMTKLAVYRDAAGRLHERSAVCPHLKCIVHWNDVEKSWDCPCHGSRFRATGELITGPAVEDLAHAKPASPQDKPARASEGNLAT
jgi:nitrite reductase/ring-hydroxylating ferredoxin subunit